MENKVVKEKEIYAVVEGYLMVRNAETGEWIQVDSKRKVVYYDENEDMDYYLDFVKGSLEIHFIEKHFNTDFIIAYTEWDKNVFDYYETDNSYRYILKKPQKIKVKGEEIKIDEFEVVLNKRRCEMSVVEFRLRVSEEIALVEFELKRDLVPEDLRDINPPDPVKEGFASKVVVLSGRGPIWLYGFLIHEYHPVKAIAVFDPRLNGAVIVQSHHPSLKVGDVIPREKWEKQGEGG